MLEHSHVISCARDLYLVDRMLLFQFWVGSCGRARVCIFYSSSRCPVMMSSPVMQPFAARPPCQAFDFKISLEVKSNVASVKSPCGAHPLPEIGSDSISFPCKVMQHSPPDADITESPAGRSTLPLIVDTPSPQMNRVEFVSASPSGAGDALMEMPVLQCNKRRRLHGKQRGDPRPPASAPSAWSILNDVWTSRDRKSLDARIRTFASSRFAGRANTLIQVAGASHAEKRAWLVSAWHNLGNSRLLDPFVREQWWVSLQKNVPGYHGPAPDVATFDGELKEKSLVVFRTGQHRDFRIQLGALLTYNDDYHTNLRIVESIIEQHRGDLNAAALAMRDERAVQDLWLELTTHAAAVHKEHNYLSWSAAMELSPNAEHVGRIHMHVYFALSGKFTGGISFAEVMTHWAFRGRSPSHVSASSRPPGRRTLTQVQSQAHYYCQAPKIGQIFSGGSVRPFEDFMISSKMVLELWKQKKITTELAMAEILKTRDSVPRWLQELSKTHDREAESSNKKLVVSALTSMELCRFKQATVSEMAFLRQFGHLPLRSVPAGEEESPRFEGPQLRRYAFMVYDGKSRTGKTERAAAWWLEKNTLVVNAQNTNTPSLRDYDPSKHLAIVYDEGSWALPSSQRMLFQSGPRGVKLAQSNCNIDVYEVLLYGVPQIITTNNFWKGWSSLDTDHVEAKEWLQANMHFVQWNEPTWESK